MSDTLRNVTVDRVSAGRYIATNADGVTFEFGSGDDIFSPVELLLTALAGCTAIDADVATSRHSEPVRFTVTAQGDKLNDEPAGSRMENLAITFHVEFPEGEAGDKARAILPRAVKLSHDKYCTVSRTVERGTPVSSSIAQD